MTQPDAIAEELRLRIAKDIAYYNGGLPERNAIAWRGYLSGLLEWEVLNPQVFDSLMILIPRVDDDPAAAILKGRE